MKVDKISNYIRIGATGHYFITDKEIINRVKGYKYLGVTITSDGRRVYNMKIKRVKNVITTTYYYIKRLYTIKKQNHVFNTFIESGVTYDTEV